MHPAQKEVRQHSATRNLAVCFLFSSAVAYQKTLTGLLKESARKGTVVYSVSSLSAGRNISYHIQRSASASGWNNCKVIPGLATALTIDSNGIIRLTKMVDFEALNVGRDSTRVKVCFDISLKDRGTPPRDQLFLFWLFFLDVNDNPPSFTSPIPASINISQRVEVGTEILKVAATDPDHGNFGSVSYSLEQLNGSFSTFFINPVTGQIHVNKSLASDTVSRYFLRITAQDKGQPPKRTSTVLTVEVLRSSLPTSTTLNSNGTSSRSTRANSTSFSTVTGRPSSSMPPIGNKSVTSKVGQATTARIANKPVSRTAEPVSATLQASPSGSSTRTQLRAIITGTSLFTTTTDSEAAGQVASSESSVRTADSLSGAIIVTSSSLRTPPPHFDAASKQTRQPDVSLHDNAATTQLATAQSEEHGRFPISEDLLAIFCSGLLLLGVIVLAFLLHNRR